MTDEEVSMPNCLKRSCAVELIVKDLISSNSEGVGRFFSTIVKGMFREANSSPRKAPTMPPPDIKTD
jgi:hypothetical protein